MKEATEHHSFRITVLWLCSIASIIILGIVGYAVYLVRQYVPIIGYIWLVSIGLLPAMGLIFMGIWLARYFLQVENIELGPSGNLIRWFHKTTEYHPLGIKEHRTRIKEEKEKFQVPALLDILKQGILGNGDLLLGYHLEGDPRWGMWDDLRTFVVAGKSRSGKTVTMAFFIVQALLSGAIVYVCDPHHLKPTGLLMALKPIWKHLRIARTYEEIIAATAEFRGHMKARQEGRDTNFIPMLLVYDEWSEMLREIDKESNELVVNTVLSCAEAYAGFNGYAMLGGHEWTARESGGKKGGAVRRGFHSVFVHRLDDEYAKYLLKGQAGKKAAQKSPTIRTGQAYFQDSEGELDYLCIPFYGKDKEAIFEVAEMLKQLPSPGNFEKLSPVTPAPQPISSISLIDGESVNTVKQLPGPVNSSPNVTNEGEGFTSEESLYTPEKETKILLAVIELQKKGKFNRKDIMEYLGWSRKQWPIIKAVCDKHRIAMI